MPFDPSVSDVKRVLEEITKFYVLVEKNLPEDVPQELAFDMHKYSKSLQEMVYEKYGLEIPYHDIFSMFKDCFGVPSKEKSNYIKLTHHMWRKDGI